MFTIPANLEMIGLKWITEQKIFLKENDKKKKYLNIEIRKKDSMTPLISSQSEIPVFVTCSEEIQNLSSSHVRFPLNDDKIRNDIRLA